MRFLPWVLCAVGLGCGGPPVSMPSANVNAAHAVAATVDQEPRAQPRAVAADDTVPKPADVPPDLGARKKGGDWPGFLGPFGTSVSPEKGIIAPWPKKGLRLVWQKQLGTGYAMPSISRGRLFLFDRHGNQAWLRCLNS